MNVSTILWMCPCCIMNVSSAVLWMFPVLYYECFHCYITNVSTCYMMNASTILRMYSCCIWMFPLLYLWMFPLLYLWMFPRPYLWMFPLLYDECLHNTANVSLLYYECFHGFVMYVTVLLFTVQHSAFWSECHSQLYNAVHGCIIMLVIDGIIQRWRRRNRITALNVTGLKQMVYCKLLYITNIWPLMW